MYIPYGRQSIDNDDIEEVVKVLKSDFITTGPKIDEFERKIADYVGAKYAVAVSNGTAALHIACLAMGLKKNDEVITTPITFAASANCVLYCGGKVTFADIDKDNYNIAPADIEKHITKRTKAIVAVDYTGQPCDMDEISKIAKKYNLIVIEDAAHALGASYKGRKVGTLADMTTFSFHPVKHITTGEGGMVVTDNEELYNRLCLFRTHGITRNENNMKNNEGTWYYEQHQLGYNYRITDFQCALGISQLNKLNTFVEKRQLLADRYNKAFENEKNIIIPKQENYSKNSWHLYVIQVLNKERKCVFDKLREYGIGVNVHYIPVYKHPYYREHGYNNVCCTNAENLYEKIISLPLYPSLSIEEQDYVINKVIEIVSRV